MTQLPVVYFAELFERLPEHPGDGISRAALGEFIEALHQSGAQSPAVPAILAGELLPDAQAPGILLVLGDCRLPTLAHWTQALSAQGFTSLVGCACADAQYDGFLERLDAPLLLGHGTIVASRGLTGRPLVNLGLAELRRELADSRARLSELAGYPVDILLPAVSTFGHAVDGLVLDEARRAGYRWVLVPGTRVSDLHAAPGAPARPTQLSYRIASSDDDPQRLAHWTLGEGLSRQRARVHELLRRPRRILSRMRTS